ncbi:MAG TPA: hypothetical protein HA362_00300 [Nanoarchaeota archaeon]|nr:hypothetical protein [Nanoarchaeota archaeon]
MGHDTPKHAEYYEAIIQLRPATEEILRFILNRVKERSKNVHISKLKELPTGVDIYISSQSYARSIGKKLKRSFQGDLKVTRTLHTQDRMSGKQLYRATVLFRLKPKEETEEIQEEDL